MSRSIHIICDFVYKGSMGDIYSKIKKSISVGGLHIVNEFCHHFSPYGLSLFFVLSESHISIHTWEEDCRINCDIFTCGDCNPMVTLDCFLDQFEVESKDIQIIHRN